MRKNTVRCTLSLKYYFICSPEITNSELHVRHLFVIRKAAYRRLRILYRFFKLIVFITPLNLYFMRRSYLLVIIVCVAPLPHLHNLVVHQEACSN